MILRRIAEERVTSATTFTFQSPLLGSWMRTNVPMTLLTTPQ